MISLVEKSNDMMSSSVLSKFGIKIDLLMVNYWL
jgi:hypothetical protein